jgi:GT2 family glycosyltransferase
VDWVSGAALAVRRDVFRKIDGFDERYFMYFEDIDLCRRVVAAGYTIHYLAETEVFHLGGGSQPGGLSPTMQTEYRRSEMLYYSLHASLLQNVMLRLYLGGKFLSYYALGDKDQREAATRILPALYRPLHAHRD